MEKITHIYPLNVRGYSWYVLFYIFNYTLGIFLGERLVTVKEASDINYTLRFIGKAQSLETGEKHKDGNNNFSH